jgi:protein-tyrosine phosphatase
VTEFAQPGFRVLVVCTANHCRSPIAEQLLARDAAGVFGTADWRIGSAGTAVRGPWPLHEHAATVLAERLPAEQLPALDGHRSVQLTTALIADADLVLTATRQHRGAVVTTLPGAVGRTFTIGQFARLCDAVPEFTAHDPGEAGRELLTRAKRARSSLQPVPGDLDDLPDPMGGGLADFRVCADRLQRSIDSILRPLRSAT